MSNIILETYTLPTYWASALINGDESGLTDAESAAIEAWLKQHNYPWCVDCSEESEFRHLSYDCPNELAGDYSTYTFDVSNH